MVIHELGVHLVRGGNFLENGYPEQPMSCLWSSIEHLRCFPLTQSLFPRFVRASMCLHPCVRYSEPFFSPRIEEGPENMSLCVFGGRPETCRALHNAGYSI